MTLSLHYESIAVILMLSLARILFLQRTKSKSGVDVSRIARSTSRVSTTGGSMKGGMVGMDSSV